MTALNTSIPRPPQMQQAAGSLTEDLLQAMLNYFYYNAVTYTAAGAIAIQQALVLLNPSSGSIAMTMAAPDNPQDDNKEIIFVALAQGGHTITFTGGTLRSGALGKRTTLTFPAADAGASATVIIKGGLYYLTGNNNVTVS